MTKPTKPSKPYRKKSRAKYADDPTEPDRCHAARKSDGERCGNRSTPGQMVCRYHGGKSDGSGTLKTGRFSYVLQRSREAYEDALADRAGLHNLDETLAVLHVLTERAAKRMEDSDTPELRTAALGKLKDALAAMDAGDGAKAGRDFRELHDILENGIAADQAEAALVEAAERLAKRKEAATALQLKGAEVMNKTALVAAFGRMLQIFALHGGPKAAAAAAREIATELFDANDPEGWLGLRPLSS